MGVTAKVEIEVLAFGPDEERVAHQHRQMPPLDNDQRQATLNIIRGSLVTLLDSLDEWVPESFVARSNTTLDVVISFDMVEVDSEVARSLLAAQKRLDNVREDLLALRRDLDE